MINEENFRKTEGRLYRHYRKLKEIDKLEHRINILENQKEEIRQDLRETNITIEPESRSIDYSQERVQNSSSGTSYAEAAAIREIEKLEEELKRTIRQIRKLRAKIREIKNQDSDIEHAIGLLDEIYKQFVLLKYKDDLSVEQISRELHMSSKSTVSDWREKVIIDIAKLLYKNAG
ncbi:hypothetical protein [Clostridium sp. OS1-26]|uniref:hypothetical protein n=1 Tax=Clostridium sp. OS1-26 TaxID=3070681 RepID=UPI0027E21149|nr:hypothetical protein [Clostridium sp. OS1-26]WML33190.1 hypothetical protein RCG18_17780 [Clostridium sp. OS1-26]